MRIENPRVGGSIPPRGTIYIKPRLVLGFLLREQIVIAYPLRRALY